MNICFLYKDRDWTNIDKYSDAQNIIQDLGLKTIFSISAKEIVWENAKIMSVAPEDLFLSQIMKTVMMSPLETKEQIAYRHEMLKDALGNPELIGELYALVGEMLKKWDSLGRKMTGKGNMDGGARLLSDLEILKLFVETLGEIKRLFRENITRFEAAGFLSFYERLCLEYSDEKEAALRKVLDDVAFYTHEISEDGQDKTEAKPRLVLGCNILKGLKCDDFVVEEVSTKNKKFRGHNSFVDRVQEYFYSKQPGAIPVRKNLNIFEQANDLEYEVVRYVVSACSPFVLELNDFFDQFHFQIGFFKAASNLMQHIERFHVPFCYPRVCDNKTLRFDDLKEFVMAIEQRVSPVGNTCNIEDCKLLVVTGANQGGKSTFLRSVGIAQVMMQCGLPVIAKEYESGIFPSFFTHFTRREDSAMNSGRLDEELKRMSQIIDNLGKHSMVLLNESFATTTEKEGSVIAYDIIKALTEANVKVLTVTHLLSFAQRVYQETEGRAGTQTEFLSAEREPDGKRTFRMIQHEPELSSFGMDLFYSIIGE